MKELLNSDQRGWLTLLLIALFLVAWIWTEYTEYVERDNFTTEVYQFVSKGDRYTQAEGDKERDARLKLEERVRELEESRNGQ